MKITTMHWHISNS